MVIEIKKKKKYLILIFYQVLKFKIIFVLIVNFCIIEEINGKFIFLCIVWINVIYIFEIILYFKEKICM